MVPRLPVNRALVVAFGAFLFALAATAPAANAFDPPANDDLPDAEVVSGESVSVEGTLTGATSESGEPQHGGMAAQQSVWYRWSSPHDGIATVDTCGSVLPDTRLGVYSGSDISSLERLASNDSVGAFEAEGGTPQDCGVHQSRAAFPVAEGETYVLAVDRGSLAPANANAFEMHLGFGDPPPNDDFADATPVSGELIDLEGDNLAAGEEQGEPGAEAAGSNASVWFTWTAPARGVVTIPACVGFNSRVALFTGDSLGSLQALQSGGCSAYGPFLPQLDVDVSPGTTYTIMVDGGGVASQRDASRGSFVGLQLRLDRSPSNDLRSDATELVGRRVYTEGTTVGATWVPGEPGGGTVWYRWRAPADGWLRLKACQDASLAVYRGERDEAFASTTWDSDACERPLDGVRVRADRRYKMGVFIFDQLDYFIRREPFSFKLALRARKPATSRAG